MLFDGQRVNFLEECCRFLRVPWHLLHAHPRVRFLETLENIKAQKTLRRRHSFPKTFLSIDFPLTLQSFALALLWLKEEVAAERLRLGRLHHALDPDVPWTASCKL